MSDRSPLLTVAGGLLPREGGEMWSEAALQGRPPRFAATATRHWQPSQRTAEHHAAETQRQLAEVRAALERQAAEATHRAETCEQGAEQFEQLAASRAETIAAVGARLPDDDGEDGP